MDPSAAPNWWRPPGYLIGERLAEAGALLGLAAAIKLFPAYLFLLYAAQWRLKPLLSGLATLLCVTLITLAVLGPESYRDYLWEVLPRQNMFRGLAYNFSIAGFWHKLFDPVGEAGAALPIWPSPSIARLGTLVCDLGVTATVIGLAYRWRRPEERDAAFGLAVTAMLLVSPVTWGSTRCQTAAGAAGPDLQRQARRSPTRGLRPVGKSSWSFGYLEELLTVLVWGSSRPFSPVFCSCGISEVLRLARYLRAGGRVDAGPGRYGADTSPHVRARPADSDPEQIQTCLQSDR